MFGVLPGEAILFALPLGVRNAFAPVAFHNVLENDVKQIEQPDGRDQSLDVGPHSINGKPLKQ